MLSAAKIMMSGITATSTVLFCDITPKLLVKIILPFIQINNMTCVCLIVILFTIGYVFASFSFRNVYIGLSGVVLNSAASGIGDVFLSTYSTRFSTKAMGSYMSGTGLASLFSSLLFALLVDVLNCNPKYVIFSFLPMPYLFLECYLLSSEGHSPGQQQESTVVVDYEVLSETPLSLSQQVKLSLKSTYIYVLTFIAVFSSYTINQSVNPVIEFSGYWSGKYFTFSQVASNLGSFMGKSSLSVFKLKRSLLFIPSLTALSFLILYCFEAVYHFINQFWLLLSFGVGYGFCSGTVITQALYLIQIEAGRNKRFAVCVQTFMGSFSVFFASVLGFWLEDFLR
ncbi:CLN3_protein [Hexamita inflata]|uniref:CLN3 protein n=1 Tax=Hexamita inflata TaxID=28002 RepID=A0AA86NFZ9_9EUKA|nr:CLN3 protein [Hexamita inflata]